MLARAAAESMHATAAADGRWGGMRKECAPVMCLAIVAATLACGGCAGEAPLPPRAVLLNATGAQALALGDLASAEASLSVAIEYSPRFVEAWVNLGYVELRRGSFDQARRDFLKARALNRDLPAPHHALGVLAEAQGDGPAAEAFYRDSALRRWSLPFHFRPTPSATSKPRYCTRCSH